MFCNYYTFQEVLRTFSTRDEILLWTIVSQLCRDPALNIQFILCLHNIRYNKNKLAKNNVQRAKCNEQRAESKEQQTKTRHQRAKTNQQQAKSDEQRAKRI